MILVVVVKLAYCVTGKEGFKRRLYNRKLGRIQSSFGYSKFEPSPLRERGMVTGNGRRAFIKENVQKVPPVNNAKEGIDPVVGLSVFSLGSWLYLCCR